MSLNYHRFRLNTQKILSVFCFRELLGRIKGRYSCIATSTLVYLFFFSQTSPSSFLFRCIFSEHRTHLIEHTQNSKQLTTSSDLARLGGVGPSNKDWWVTMTQATIWILLDHFWDIGTFFFVFFNREWDRDGKQVWIRRLLINNSCCAESHQKYLSVMSERSPQ